MIDFHSHIIPGVDDGSKSEEMTLEMIKMAAASGTEKVVATPHYIRGRFQVPKDEIKKEINRLKNLVKEMKIPIEIYGGQEIYYSDNILQYYLDGEIGTIEDTRYMLVELPIKGFDPEKVINTLYEVQLKGVVIILAHPERYIEFIKKPSLINKFLEEGFLFQLNAGSISGDFGKDVKKTAEIFLAHDIYSVIGSDGHRVKSRNTDMTKGMEEANKLKPGIIDVFKDNGYKILRNEEVRTRGKNIVELKGIKGLMKKIFD